MKIKTSDNVIVITGKDKGKIGKVARVALKKKQVVIEKVNIRTKHVKKTANRAGERVRFEAPINISNVMLVCPQCNKRTRVGYQVPDSGKKIRICKKCNASVELTFQKKKSKS